jgi:hypothetical protein
MNIKLVIFFTVIASFFCFHAVAQTLAITDYYSADLGYVLPLKKGDKMAGYARCYIDKSDDQFHLSVCDENLTKEASISLEMKWNKFLLFGMAYNGTNVGLYFLSKKQDEFLIISYDGNLKNPHTVRIPEETMKGNRFYYGQVISGKYASVLGNYEVNRYKEVATPRADMKLVPVEGKGFIVQGLISDIQGSVILYYDNDLKFQWKYITDKTSKGLDEFIINGTTDKVIYGIHIKPSVITVRNFDYNFFMLNLETGKISMDVPIQSKVDNQIQITNALYSKDENLFYVFGEYGISGAGFNMPSRSDGFFMKTFNESGKEVADKFFSFDNDIAGKLDPAGKKLMEKDARTFVHEVLLGKDNSIFLITEQFKENYGIRIDNSLDVITGKPKHDAALYAQMSTLNIVLYKLKKDYSLQSVKVFEKKAEVNHQPAPFSKLDIFIIAQMAQTLGQYDFMSVEKGHGNDYFVLNFRDRDSDLARVLRIRLDSDGKTVLKKAEYTPAKKFDCEIFPAKDGFLMKAEYSKSQKQANYSLMPVSQ